MRKKQQTRDGQKGAHLLKVCLVGSSQHLINELSKNNEWGEPSKLGSDFNLYPPIKVEDEFFRIQICYFTHTVNEPRILKSLYKGAYSLIFVFNTNEKDSLKRIKSQFKEYLKFLPELRAQAGSDPEYRYVLLVNSPNDDSSASREAGEYAQSIKAHYIEIQKLNEEKIVEIFKFLASSYLEYNKLGRFQKG